VTRRYQARCPGHAENVHREAVMTRSRAAEKKPSDLPTGTGLGANSGKRNLVFVPEILLSYP